MGKKSLTKSTTKKKATAKKKTTAKKTETKAASPKKETKKPTAKKKPAPKKPTLKSILNRKFDAWAPKKLFKATPDSDLLSGFSAPPAIDEKDKEKATALRALLNRQFNLTVPDKAKAEKPKKETAPKAKPKAPAKEKPAAKPKKTLSVRELINLQFDSWQPKKLYAPAVDDAFEKGFSAPPAFESKDKAEADRIRGLIARTFDMKVIEAAGKARAEKEAAEIAKAEAKAKAEKEAQEKAKAEAEAKAKAEKEAAEKAKAEAEAKAKAEKEAQEKAKAEAEAKAKAEKEAAEKAKAEAEAKAKAEKEAAEKAKAEAEAKAKAEKEAQEKAKAEAEAKAKAEKEAAEKAKAEAEAKAKAEEEAAEKAKAEAEAKAKAEKEAEEKAKAKAKQDAEEKAAKPPAPPSIPTDQGPTEPPMNNAVKVLVALVGGLFALLIIASAMNTNNYYLKPADGGIDIWQGKFSPTGKKLVMHVPGASVEEPVKDVYAKKEALVPAYQFYIQKAEALSEKKGQPDFEAIKTNLYKAIHFAPDRQHKNAAKTRLSNIDFLFSLYKADVAAGKNTIEGYESALTHLRSAATLATGTSQRDLLDQKTAEVNKKRDLLEKQIAAEEAKKAAEAETLAKEKESQAAESAKTAADPNNDPDNAPNQTDETPKAKKH